MNWLFLRIFVFSIYIFNFLKYIINRAKNVRNLCARFVHYINHIKYYLGGIK